MPEKIDSLTLDIGITSEEFQAGVNRILDSMGRMESSATEVGEGMGASFASVGEAVAGLAWRFAGMFLAFKSIEGLVDYFKALSHELGHLGMAAEYLGQSSVELRRFGEVAELTGGRAEDAIGSVQGLESAIFGLEFEGQMSQNLMWLQRLGVAYLDAGGHMKDFKTIVFDTAAALQRQFPGAANQPMRLQAALKIFEPGLARAVSGPIDELRKFYSTSVENNKNVTDKTVARQVALQRDLTTLSYTLKNEAVRALDALTPAIRDLIKSIEKNLIPTIDELISDVMDWIHPERLVNKAMSNPEGVGPIGITHPLNTLEAVGIGLGIRAGQFHEWFEENISKLNKWELGQIPNPPPQVAARLPPGMNLDALKLLHLEAGGDEGDPTWSRAVSAYGGLGGPGGAAQFVGSAMRSLRSPAVNPSSLTTPQVSRPSQAPPDNGSFAPISSTQGPRIQIDSIGPIYSQATDAEGLMADINRAAQRKLLVAQSDPGLA